MASSHWMSRPPKTARIARRIWDLITVADGEEPCELWHNWNGVVYGQQLSDVDYGAWKRDGGVYGYGEDVDGYILIMAGTRLGGMLEEEYLAKYNPKALDVIRKQIAEFKEKYGGNQNS